MGWSLIQSPAGQGSGNSAGQRSLAFGSNVASGNLLVAAIATFNIGSATVSVSDTQGATWTQLGSYSAAGPNVVSLWGTLAGALSSAADTVKFTPSVSVYGGFCIAEFNYSAAATLSVDGTSTNIGNSATPSSGNITVAASNELVLTGFCQGSHSLALTAGAGFSQAAAQQDGQNFEGCYLDYLLNGSSGSSPYDDNASLANSAAWAALGVSIKPTAGVGGGGFPFFIGGGVGRCIGFCLHDFPLAA
jgi:hypothetical protein